MSIRITFFLALAAVAGGTLVALSSYTTIGGAVTVLLALTVASALVLSKLVPQKDRKFLLTLAVVGLAVKAVGVLARLGVGELVYGLADARRYDVQGGLIAQSLRAGDFSAATAELSLGTETMEFLTGLFYSITGPTLFGAFLAFGFLAFVGSLLFLKAFMLAMPGGNHRLFATLVFLFPTIVFWPSSLGKDSLIYFFLGLGTYGAARLMTRITPGGVLTLMAGMGGAFVIRPHVSFLFGLALVAAFVFKLPVRSIGSLIGRGAVAAAAVGAAIVLLNWSASYFQSESLTPGSAFQLLVTQAETEISEEDASGSTYKPTPVTSPLWVPSAIVAVLARPFAWEAHNPQVLVESVVGALLILVMLRYAGNLTRALTGAWRRPFLIFCITYGLLMILTLSTLSNFGVVARQRAAAMPFVFAAVAAVPATQRKRQASPYVSSIPADVPSRAPSGGNVANPAAITNLPAGRLWAHP